MLQEAKENVLQLPQQRRQAISKLADILKLRIQVGEYHVIHTAAVAHESCHVAASRAFANVVDAWSSVQQTVGTDTFA